MKILIADDDPQMVRALRITLTATGHQVITVPDGRQAIAAAIQERPDLYLLDLGMPALDGLDVIHAVRGWSSAPILVISGRTGSAEKVEALDAGADWAAPVIRSGRCVSRRFRFDGCIAERTRLGAGSRARSAGGGGCTRPSSRRSRPVRAVASRSC